MQVRKRSIIRAIVNNNKTHIDAIWTDRIKS